MLLQTHPSDQRRMSPAMWANTSTTNSTNNKGVNIQFSLPSPSADSSQGDGQGPSYTVTRNRGVMLFDLTTDPFEPEETSPCASQPGVTSQPISIRHVAPSALASSPQSLSPSVGALRSSGHRRESTSSFPLPCGGTLSSGHSDVSSDCLERSGGCCDVGSLPELWPVRSGFNNVPAPVPSVERMALGARMTKSSSFAGLYCGEEPGRHFQVGSQHAASPGAREARTLSDIARSSQGTESLSDSAFSSVRASKEGGAVWQPNGFPTLGGPRARSPRGMERRRRQHLDPWVLTGTAAQEQLQNSTGKTRHARAQSLTDFSSGALAAGGLQRQSLMRRACQQLEDGLVSSQLPAASGIECRESGTDQSFMKGTSGGMQQSLSEGGTSSSGRGPGSQGSGVRGLSPVPGSPHKSSLKGPKSSCSSENSSPRRVSFKEQVQVRRFFKTAR